MDCLTHFSSKPGDTHLCWCFSIQPNKGSLELCFFDPIVFINSKGRGEDRAAAATTAMGEQLKSSTES